MTALVQKDLKLLMKKKSKSKFNKEERVDLWPINQRRIKRRTEEKHENKYMKGSKEDYEKAIEILKREG